MNIVDLSIKRPVLTTTILLALAFFGVFAYTSLPVSLTPDVKIPYVTIQTVYAGASPTVMEAQVTKKIEDQVASISELDQILSYSMDSASIVLVKFRFGKDANLALQEVKDKVEVIISDLPDDAKRPAITKLDVATAMPVMNIVLQGNMDPTELYTLGSTAISDRFSQVPGVASIEVSGGQEREIHVELDRATVFSRSIPLTQIAGMLAASNMELPGGNIATEGRDLPVRLKGEFSGLDEIRDIDVPTATGVFKLRQLAEVVDTRATVRERTILVDKVAGTRDDNALLLSVVKNPTSNTIEVVNGVQKAIGKLEKEYGNTVTFKVVKEDATYVRDSVNDVMSNVYMGIILTGLILLLFLHDLRSTLIVALAMPFSLIATFLVMKAMGISLNIMSLMGLSSATGTLVANSIVVLENIFRYKELGHDRQESASKGTADVVVAVLASTMTNVCVFLPLANMEGIMGAMLYPFAATVVISTLFSIFVSFSLTPLMASRILPEKVKKDGKIGLALEAIFDSWSRAYARTLEMVIKNRRRSASVLVATLVAFVGSLALFSKVKFELAPTTDGGKIQINVELPQGSNLDATAATLAEIEKRVEDYPEVNTILTSLGNLSSMNQDVSVAKMEVFLSPRGERAASNGVIAVKMLRELSDVPGAEIRVKALSEFGMDSGSGNIDFYLKGEDNDVLLQLSEKVKNRMSKVEGIVNPATSSKAGKAEVVFEPNRKRLSQDGLTVQAVAVTLRAAVDGLVTTTYKEGGEEYDVRVMIKDADLLDLEDLKNIPVVTASGVQPLSRYADIRLQDGYSKVMRTDKERTVEIYADLLPGYAQGQVMGEVTKAVREIELPTGYTLKAAGSAEQLGDTVKQLLTVFIIAVVLTYMLLCAILESFVQPIYILATVPLSIIGIVAACLLANTTLNFIAMLGIIMLVGIVVNNAILILDYYRQLKREEGLNTHDALMKACPTKLKPILMSNIAIVLSMVPMAMGWGASGAEMREPMGVVIIGGIVSSTVMTLWVIPALEVMFTRRGHGATTVKE